MTCPEITDGTDIRSARPHFGAHIGLYCYQPHLMYTLPLFVFGFLVLFFGCVGLFVFFFVWGVGFFGEALLVPSYVLSYVHSQTHKTFACALLTRKLVNIWVRDTLLSRAIYEYMNRTLVFFVVYVLRKFHPSRARPRDIKINYFRTKC